MKDRLLFRGITVSLIATAVFLLLPSLLPAAQIKLRWDRNQEVNVVGYEVYMRLAHEDYNYSVPVWTGSENQCVLDGLADNTNYYFVVRAVSLSGAESDDSVEIEYDYERDYANAALGFRNQENGYTGVLGSAVLGGASGAVGGSGGGGSCFVGALAAVE